MLYCNYPTIAYAPSGARTGGSLVFLTFLQIQKCMFSNTCKVVQDEAAYHGFKCYATSSYATSHVFENIHFWICKKVKKAKLPPVPAPLGAYAIVG